MMEHHDFTWMVQALRASGTLFDEGDIERSGLWLNMNDIFYYGADAEQIESVDVPAVYALWRSFGWQGVTWWVWQRRGQEPLKKIQPAILARLQRE